MLTTRGFWFFVVLFASLAAATIIGATQLMLVCFTALFWFLIQWSLFHLRLRLTLRNLHVERTLRTARGDVDSIWARQRVDVFVAVYNDGPVDLPYVVVMERLPALAGCKDGSLRIDGTLTKSRRLLMKYQIECRSPGRLRFEGVKLQLADLQGFFTFATFLRDPREYRVLPRMAVEGSHSAFVKQHNVLPLLGTHRHARPGSSSELLDLRDYIPGDPPKMIAWKVSARRDRLITREFESEVPIRCTLFLDMSNSVRLGPPGETALARLVEIAAALAQANAAERDLTGVCLFDETGVQETIKAGRGSKHLLKMLGVLTHAASLLPCTPAGKLVQLLPLAYGLLQDVYPEWLDRDVNRFPAWLPLWSPQPSYTIPQPTIASDRWWKLPWVWTRRKLARLPVWIHSQLVRRVLPSYHVEYRWRKELAAVLAVHFQLGPGGLARLLEDDHTCVDYVQRFLAEHQVAYPYPFYDDEGRYLFAAPEKANVLAKALTKAITHGKDNELFVLCVDLLECAGEGSPLSRYSGRGAGGEGGDRHPQQGSALTPDPSPMSTRERGESALATLERTVCVAKARHHQVVVICPWPAAVAPPGSKPTPQIPADLHRALLRADTARLHQAFAKLKHAFGRLGVPVICAGQDDTVDWIMHRMRPSARSGTRRPMTTPSPPTPLPRGGEGRNGISIRHYQAVCALALIAIFLVQMQQDFPMLLNALIVVLGTFGIMFRARVSPLIVFLALTAGQLIEQYKQNQFFVPDPRSARFLEVSNVLLSLATLTYLVAQYRLHGLRFNVLPYDPRQEAPPHPQPLSPGGAMGELGQARTEQSLSPAELMWLVLPVPFFALAAEVFAFVLRQHWNLVGYPPRWRQFLVIAWLLVVVMFAAAHLFRHWKRLQMDRASALLLLQDVLWHETRGEQRRINRWIAWRKVKQREET